jgi:hypothetical protein
VFIEGEFCLQNGRPRNVQRGRWKATTPAGHVAALIVIGHCPNIWINRSQEIACRRDVGTTAILSGNNDAHRNETLGC